MLQTNLCRFIPIPIQAEESNRSHTGNIKRQNILEPPDMKLHKRFVEIEILKQKLTYFFEASPALINRAQYSVRSPPAIFCRILSIGIGRLGQAFERIKKMQPSLLPPTFQGQPHNAR